ncbi:MAG TPA: PH domain-containing protein [Myxococcota bacterium]|nr:PH domain-containing protein [Myxococcota bacterium]
MTAEPTQRFPLAPMSGVIRVLTAAVLAIPAVFVAAGLVTSAAILVPVGVVTALLYVAIWLAGRPTVFEVAQDGLHIRFPWRSRAVPAREIAGVRELSSRTFREEFGFAVRIGVGGLWGGFGWLWTSQRGLVELYVSRLDGFVLVERRAGGMPLLLTPAEPEDFVDALSALL